MKIQIKFAIVFLIINCLFRIDLSAQVGINNDGSSPDAFAMLDVKSTTQGMLIPRMTTAQRDLINSPTDGLMIYNNTDSTFNYYNGKVWTVIGKDNLGNHTASTTIQLDGNYISNDGDNEGITINNLDVITDTSGHNSCYVRKD